MILSRGARDLARGLPEALAQCAGDSRLTAALQQPVEHVITTSVRRDPRPLADALFPVIGPAIRKAIAHTLSGMIESLNRTLEHSVSVRALRVACDRVADGQAVRRGRATAHAGLPGRAGLPDPHADGLTAAARIGRIGVRAGRRHGLRHAHRDPGLRPRLVRRRDRRHARHLPRRRALRRHRAGPQAYLAAVVRGTVPPDLRTTLQHALETIHLQRGADLAAFAGDAAPFEDARPVLQECLEARIRQPEAGASRSRWWWVVLAAVLVAACAWGGLRWRDAPASIATSRPSARSRASSSSPRGGTAAASW